MFNWVNCMFKGHEWYEIKGIRRRCLACGEKQWWNSDWEEWRVF